MKKIVIMIIFFLIFPLIQGCENVDKVQSDYAFSMRAVIKKVDDKIEVDVIESNYAYGLYWVLTFDETKFYNNEGKEISKGNLKKGDTINIIYNGQVMMSYPPQIVAHEIKLI